MCPDYVQFNWQNGSRRALNAQMHKLRGPDPISYSLLYMNIVAFGFHTRHVEGPPVNQHWQNYLSQRGRRGAAISCSKSCVVADMSLVADISLDGGDNMAVLLPPPASAAVGEAPSAQTELLERRPRGRNGCKRRLLGLIF